MPSRRERLRKSIMHEKTDSIPYELPLTLPVYNALKDYYGTEDLEDLIYPRANVGNDALRDFKLDDVGLDKSPDEFGAVWTRTDDDMGCVIEYPLSRPSLQGYTFPDPYAEGRFNHIEALIGKYHERDKFVFGHIGLSLFERAWSLRGMERLLLDFIENQAFVDDLLDHICEFDLGIIEQLTALDLDGFWFGDDWGGQHGLIMGPAIWRRFIQPRLARMYQMVKSKGLPLAIHSCGEITEIIPDLIELGVNALNPFQPEALDIYRLKRDYGDRLCFWGGISTQQTMPYGSPEDVRREVRERIRVFGQDGGYIVSPAHCLQKDVPLANVLAFLDAVKDQG